MSDGCMQATSCRDGGSSGTSCGPCSVERLCPGTRVANVVTEGPVCGSDGRTYAGLCAARLAACLRGVSPDVLHNGPCDESAGSGGNDEPFTGIPSILALSYSRGVYGSRTLRP